MLSNVMDYVKQCPQEGINYAKAQLILGARDQRTMLKYAETGRG